LDDYYSICLGLIESIYISLYHTVMINPESKIRAIAWERAKEHKWWTEFVK